MKKYIIIVISTLLIGQALYSVSESEIMNDLGIKATKYEQNLLNTQLSLEWNEAFDKAKAFVIDKSKNFFGNRDTNIFDAIHILAIANDDITRLIRVTLTSPDEFNVENNLSALNEIQKKITAATNEMSKSSKKEAKSVSMLIALCLTKFTQAAKTIGECSVCYEIKQLVDYPCGNKHPDDKKVCKSCLSEWLQKPNPRCPICNAPLKR